MTLPPPPGEASPPEGRPGRGRSDLAVTFASLARQLADVESVEELFGRIAELGPQLVPGCDHCGVTVHAHRKARTAASSGPLAAAVDALQYETAEGPCLEAIKTNQVYEVSDVDADERWPTFLRRTAEETPVRSVLAYRLFVEGRTFGALNLYAEEPDAFDDRSHEVASLLAAHAAVALVNVQGVDDLRRALASRDLIATAKGILMAREGVTEQQAFDILRRASRRTNVPLRELAARIVGSREPPGSKG